ncbi:hypothetical protein TrRE_jg7853 [Triparma retinervis]|uniref:Uncharacterized protein n=1 Tax=Triparma retinervis TaxID=2557542 RepID=A0A9W7DUY5_9STRA|nr:hypothetical protein TrRE_jg7853 [Triparma retinervis]
METEGRGKRTKKTGGRLQRWRALEEDCFVESKKRKGDAKERKKVLNKKYYLKVVKVRVQERKLLNSVEYLDKNVDLKKVKAEAIDSFPAVATLIEEWVNKDGVTRSYIGMASNAAGIPMKIGKVFTGGLHRLHDHAFRLRKEE